MLHSPDSGRSEYVKIQQPKSRVSRAISRECCRLATLIWPSRAISPAIGAGALREPLGFSAPGRCCCDAVKPPRTRMGDTARACATGAATNLMSEMKYSCAQCAIIQREIRSPSEYESL